MYTQEQEEEIIKSVDRVMVKIRSELAHQKLINRENEQVFSTEEGYDYLNFTMNYNLALRVFEYILKDTSLDLEKQKDVIELFQSDLEQMVEDMEVELEGD